MLDTSPTHATRSADMPPWLVGPVDAAQVLRASQQAVHGLLVRYAWLLREDGVSAADRHALGQRVCAEMCVHLQLEAELLYPALRTLLQGSTLPVDQAEVENDCIHMLALRVRGMAADDPLLDARLLAMGELFDLLRLRETQRLLPLLRDADSAALGSALMRRREGLMQQMAGAAAPQAETADAVEWPR